MVLTLILGKTSSPAITMWRRLPGSLEWILEEIRLVNRAKWLLISELKMSEPDAHHYITHQAMDRCCAKRTVAEEIIRLYT